MCVDKLCMRLEEFHASRSPLDLRVTFCALTIDVISLYSYETSYDYLAKSDFEAGMSKLIISDGELSLLLSQYL